MAAKLIFFSHTYPTSRVEGWKGPELRVLQKFFDEIVVAPLFDGGYPVATDFPSGIRLLPPVFADNGWSFSKRKLGDIAGPRLYRHLSTLQWRQREQWADRTRRWMMSRVRIEAILRSETFRRQVRPELEGSCLYFYWGTDYADILPYLSRRQRRASLIRFHGYDLYWERNDGYLPSQASIVASADILAPISENGAAYLRGKYPGHAAKIRCHRLGTLLNGRSPRSNDGVLRVVTCSYANPVKRLPLVVEGMRHLERRAQWTHIGDGPELEAVVAASRTLPGHIRCNFVGRRQPAEVPRLYEANPFDVFVNVSESEGIPVSVMEAMAAGIPPVATDVGGTAELVKDGAGQLLRRDFSPQEFAEAVIAVADDAAHDAMRERCRTLVAREFDLVANSERIGRTLRRLAAERGLA